MQKTLYVLSVGNFRFIFDTLAEAIEARAKLPTLAGSYVAVKRVEVPAR